MDLGLLAAGVLGNWAGTAAGNAMGGGSDSTGVDYSQVMSQYSNDLKNYLTQALDYSQDYTNQAIQTVGQGENSAISALQQAQQQAQNFEIPYTNAAFGIAQALNAPYQQAGYGANTALMQSLGLSTAGIPSPQDTQQAQLAQQAALEQQQIFGKVGNPTNPGAAPTAPSSNLSNYASQATPSALLNYMIQNEQYNQKTGQYDVNLPGAQFIYTGNDINNPTGINNNLFSQANANGYLTNTYEQSLETQAQQQYQQQLQQYNTQLGQYNQYQQWAQQNGYNPNYTPSTQSSSGSQASCQNAGLQNFLNSPEYQTLFGQQAGQQMQQTGQYNPITALAANPVIPWAQQQINQTNAAHGLGNSTAQQQQQSQYLVGQAYPSYLSTLGSAFNQYQGQLAGYTSLGSSLSGASTAASLYSNLGNTLGSQAISTGQGIGNAYLTGSADQAGLLANQGSLGASANLSTGSALANGTLNIAGMASQQQAQQMASNAQTQSSALSNAGALQALNYLNPGYNSVAGTSNGYNQAGTYSGQISGLPGNNGFYATGARF